MNKGNLKISVNKCEIITDRDKNLPDGAWDSDVEDSNYDNL